MDEALAFPVAIVLVLFMSAYLPWTPPCDPERSVCVTGAAWSGLVRFVGVWDEAALRMALQEQGFAVASDASGEMRATTGGLEVRLFAHDEGPDPAETVIYLAVEHKLPFEAAEEEAQVRARLEMVLPETERTLHALQERLAERLAWRSPALDEVVWSSTIERIAGSGGFVRVRAGP